MINSKFLLSKGSLLLIEQLLLVLTTGFNVEWAVVSTYYRFHNFERNPRSSSLLSSSLLVSASLTKLQYGKNDNEDYNHSDDNTTQNEDFMVDMQNDLNIIPRRTAMKSMLSLASTTTIVMSNNSKNSAFAATTADSSSISSLLPPPPTTTTTTTTNDEKISVQPNLQCLLDLPPVKPDSVRLYLCRHGQTEYNRLKLIQGSRIDAPLNETGQKQAIRIGEALSYLGGRDETPIATIKAGVHSNLIRARETATIAATTLESILDTKQQLQQYNNNDDDEILKFISNTVSETMGQSSANMVQLGSMQLQSLSTLGEVDFGPLNEGKGSALAKADMLSTYGAWAVGKIDTKLGGEGESGRDVIIRAASALDSLVDIALNNGGSAIAFSHSTYLRILLALVMDVPLVNAATLEQKNCCINVLDVSTKEKRDVGPQSNLFGVSSSSSVAPQDFSLRIPYVEVVRVNEIQHLNGLLS